MFETRACVGARSLYPRYLIQLLMGLLLPLTMFAGSALAADPVEIGIGYLRSADVRQTLSLAEQPAADDGVAGARPASENKNPPGRFLNSISRWRKSGSRMVRIRPRRQLR